MRRGRKDLSRKEKNTNKGKVMGKKAGVERKQFGLGREQGPRKVVAEKAGKRARAITDEPGRAAVELRGCQRLVSSGPGGQDTDFRMQAVQTEDNSHPDHFDPVGKSSNHWMPIFPSRKWGHNSTHSLRTLGRLNEIRKIRHLV